ncbi:MAG: hypothetical protein ACRBB0_11380 [Pelagimonas sp.]|uniref:hypothetical protein n=1 Tax=Pelagimonas sp. TaxID=2073170 RepID=UPI003D6C0D5E
MEILVRPLVHKKRKEPIRGMTCKNIPAENMAERRQYVKETKLLLSPPERLKWLNQGKSGTNRRKGIFHHQHQALTKTSKKTGFHINIDRKYSVSKLT